MGNVLLVSSIPSDYSNISPHPSSQRFLELITEGPNGDLQFRLSLRIMSGCGSLHCLMLEEASMVMTEKAPIFECNRILLGII